MRPCAGEGRGGGTFVVMSSLAFVGHVASPSAVLSAFHAFARPVLGCGRCFYLPVIRSPKLFLSSPLAFTVGRSTPSSNTSPSTGVQEPTFRFLRNHSPAVIPSPVSSVSTSCWIFLTAFLQVLVCSTLRQKEMGVETGAGREIRQPSFGPQPSRPGFSKEPCMYHCSSAHPSLASTPLSPDPLSPVPCHLSDIQRTSPPLSGHSLS